MLKAVPQIQKTPTAASDSAIHYGYVAFHDIHIDRTQIVQPEGSPYRHVLPKRNLIPFTNVRVTEIDEKLVQWGDRPKGTPPVKSRIKTAKECAGDMEISYSDWNFQVLRPMTALDEQTAFRIFQTVQPFEYKLKDLGDALAYADERIEATEPYTVPYEGESITLAPLSESEKEIARQILPQIQASAAHALVKAEEKINSTILSMTVARNGGRGRTAPDPLDKAMAEDLGVTVPKAVDVEKKDESPNDALKMIAEALTKKDDSETAELKALVLQQQESIQALLKKEEQRERMKQARESKNNKEAA